MVTTRRVVAIAVLVASLIGAPLTGTVFATEPSASAPPQIDSSFLVDTESANATRTPFLFTDDQLTKALHESQAHEARVPVSAYGQWGGYGGHHHHGHNGASQTAIIFGSIAAIAGTGLLIYSNRPECDAFHSNECYGEKVFGGSLLAGGIVSLAVGIATWH